MLDVALLQTAYNLGVLVLDVPTGYFADRFGRKWALAAANASLVIGTVLIAFGNSLTVFIIAELFYALGIALDSGIHSAFLFEWLRSRGKENEYFRYDAFGTFLLLVIGAAGTIVAGYYAEKDLQFPVILTIGLTAIGIPAACLLREPIGKSTVTAGKAKYRALRDDASGIARIMKDTLTKPALRWALGVTVIWFWSRQYINLIISAPYFESIHLHLRHYGMLYSILTVSSGFIALFSRRLIQKPDLRLITAVGLILVPASFGLMGFIPNHLGLSGFFLFAIPYGLCTSITNTLLNRQFADHENRATFLSIVDFFVRLVASALALILGWILARHGAAYALIAAMAISGTVVFMLLPGIFRYAREHNEQAKAAD